jgi:integrase/recombinase XerD
MSLESLLPSDGQNGDIPRLNSLPKGTELTKRAQSFLLTYRVEGKSLKTMDIYGMVITLFIQFLLDKKLPTKPKEIKREHIQLFQMDCIQRKLRAHTLNCYYRALHRFFNWMIEMGHIARKADPFAGMKPPKVPKLKRKGFTNDQLRDLFLLCSGNRFLDIRTRAMVFLFFDTGLRVTELASMRLLDLNIRRGTVKVLGKGAKEREVVLGIRSQKAMIQYLDFRPDTENISLWLTEDYSPMSVSAVKNVIRRLVQRASIPSFKEGGWKQGPHTFRHTSAHSYIRNEGDLRTLQLLLGHEELSTTELYLSDITPDDVMAAHRRASPGDNLKLT